MKSLHARIAAVLIVSLTCVVALATATAVLVMQHYDDDGQVRPTLRQIEIIAGLAGGDPSTEKAAALFLPSPIEGAPRDRLTTLLREGMAKQDDRRAVIVTLPPGQTLPIASIEVAPRRWLAIPINDQPPPPGAWIVLSGWMLLILLGTAGISLMVARRVTRPLILLEAFAAGIGPGGELQTVPETGPPDIRATARALNQLKLNLRKAVESRMRLVAAAGHDFRTPLTRMRLRAEFLEEEERSKWLHNIDELERIADSAILLVQEEVGARDREHLRLDSMVQSIAGELQAMHLPVAIGGMAPVSVVGPPLAFTRAFRNLIINAATHGGGTELSVEEREGQAVLVIEDRGPGIPADLLDRVFEPFFRIDQARRQRTPGAGLGLAIAREIISRGGGELTLRNRAGGGLRQEVTLPRAS